MRGINNAYFLVLISENIREVLELGDIRENEKNIHFNHSTVHEHLMSCHTHTYHDYKRILSFYHSIGSLIDGAHPGPKTDRDNLGRYCLYRPLKRQRERKKVVLPGIEPRASGLSRQCSATKLRHPPTTTSLSFPYIALLVRIIVDIYVIFAVYVCDYERILSFYHSIGSPIDGAHLGPKTTFFLSHGVSKVYEQ